MPDCLTVFGALLTRLCICSCEREPANSMYYITNGLAAVARQFGPRAMAHLSAQFGTARSRKSFPLWTGIGANVDFMQLMASYPNIANIDRQVKQGRATAGAIQDIDVGEGFRPLPSRYELKQVRETFLVQSTPVRAFRGQFCHWAGCIRRDRAYLAYCR